MAGRPLTDKQEISVQNYCTKGLTGNVPGYSWSQAMRDAGYKEGYIVKNNHLLRGKKEIHDKIEAKKAELVLKADIKAEKILRETAGIAFSNIDDYIDVDDDGNVKIRGFKDIDRDKLAVIESVKVTKQGVLGETTQFKLCSKLTALDQLNRIIGHYKKDNEQNRPDARSFTITQLTAIIEADRAKIKEIDGITGGIAGV